MEIVETVTVAITMVGPDGRITLKPLESAVLKNLRDAGGRIVSTDRLFQLVWPGRMLSNPGNTVSSVVRSIRRNLSDIGVDPDVIETVHGKGYRFHYLKAA